MKTIDEANAELCRHRNLALTAYANRLLARGLDVDGEEFRKSMLRYAGELETWRMSALQEIACAIGAMTTHSSARH
jgi:hypothetical protein